MANGLNRVQLIGRLGKDPELHYTQNGVGVCNLTLATDESYTDRDGQKVQQTEWHRCVAYQKTAETCANYLHKGSLVYVEGSLTTRKWQDQSGQDRYTTEVKVQRVIFLDRKEGNSQQNGAQAQTQQRPAPQYDNGQPDNVPF